MNISDKDYSKLVDSFAKKSKLPLNMLNAFWIGGSICVIGQIILNLFKSSSYFSLDEAAAATTTCLIFISALLTGLGLYQKIAVIGGAGTLVPITGFANAVASPAIEFKSEGAVLGVGVKMFSISGPVIVYGTLASFIYGLILYVVKLFW